MGRLSDFCYPKCHFCLVSPPAISGHLRHHSAIAATLPGRSISKFKESVCLVSVAHVLYPIFEAIFNFGNIFSKYSFFDPPNPPFFEKKTKILTFVENLLGRHVAHVQYPIFEALFNFGYIFSKKSFFDPLNPAFLKKKPQNFAFF